MNLLEDKVYKEWVKSHLHERQSGKCIGCLDFFQSRNLEIDHIEAKSKGGSDEPSNLQLLCSTCNRMKGTSSQAVFLTKTAKLRKGKSSKGVDFGLSNSKIYSEHDWSFREVAEEILRESGMPEKLVQKELRRLYPHGFLTSSDIKDAEHAAHIYKMKIEEKEEEKKKKKYEKFREKIRKREGYDPNCVDGCYTNYLRRLKHKDDKTDFEKRLIEDDYYMVDEEDWESRFRY